MALFAILQSYTEKAHTPEQRHSDDESATPHRGHPAVEFLEADVCRRQAATVWCEFVGAGFCGFTSLANHYLIPVKIDSKN